MLSFVLEFVLIKFIEKRKRKIENLTIQRKSNRFEDEFHILDFCFFKKIRIPSGHKHKRANFYIKQSKWNITILSAIVIRFLKKSVPIIFNLISQLHISYFKDQRDFYQRQNFSERTRFTSSIPFRECSSFLSFPTSSWWNEK